jgi:tyrosyl-tRNA synthetase
LPVMMRHSLSWRKNSLIQFFSPPSRLCVGNLQGLQKTINKQLEKARKKYNTRCSTSVEGKLDQLPVTKTELAANYNWLKKMQHNLELLLRESLLQTTIRNAEINTETCNRFSKQSTNG